MKQYYTFITIRNNSNQEIKRFDKVTKYLSSLPYNESKSFRNSVFLKNGYPSLDNRELLMRRYIWYTTSKDDDGCNLNNMSERYPKFVQICNDIDKILNTTYPGHYLIVDSPGTLLRRPLNDKPCSDKELLLLNVYYAALNSLSSGDQWTCITNDKMQLMHEAGYLIECFGSAFNVRSPWFGSITELDEPVGRIGTWDEILNTLINNKPLKWRTETIIAADAPCRLMISPPSGSELQLNVVRTAFKLLDSRPDCKIFLSLSYQHKNMLEEIYNSKYFVDKQLITETRSYWDMRVKNMSDREWININLAN